MSVTLSALSNRQTITKSLAFDVIGLVVIYFIPAMSHMFSIPFYLLEPMRLMLILAIAHTSKRNGIIIALTLPLFSYLISGHPIPPKALIMAIELMLNVVLFYYFANRIKNYFGAMVISVLASKIVYYFLKYGLIYYAILDGDLFATPIYVQLILTLVYSSYLFVVFSRKEAPAPFTDPTK
jgi:hypothetical protein